MGEAKMLLVSPGSQPVQHVHVMSSAQKIFDKTLPLGKVKDITLSHR